MRSGVQRYPRTRMVLPLRVWVGEQAEDTAGLQLAHTIDISPIGGRLGGLRSELQPGQTITVQRGKQKAPFRVIWNTCLAPGENQAGVEALGGSRNIWGVDLPQAPNRATAASQAIAFANFGHAESSGMVGRATSAHRQAMIFHDKRMQWSLGLGLVVLSVLGLALYGHEFSEARLALHSEVPAPPTAAELANMTPKPWLTPLADEVTTWHSTPVPRVRVTEAPTLHMVYPVSPNVSLSGKVNLSVVIATDGRVKQVQVVSGKHPLAEAAEQAARLWRYSPYAVKGQPAEGEANVVVAFRGADAVSLEFPSKGAPAKN